MLSFSELVPTRLSMFTWSEANLCWAELILSLFQKENIWSIHPSLAWCGALHFGHVSYSLRLLNTVWLRPKLELLWESTMLNANPVKRYLCTLFVWLTIFEVFWFYHQLCQNLNLSLAQLLKSNSHKCTQIIRYLMSLLENTLLGVWLG